MAFKRETDRRIDRQMDRERERQTDRERETDRQTEGETSYQVELEASSPGLYLSHLTHIHPFVRVKSSSLADLPLAGITLRIMSCIPSLRLHTRIVRSLEPVAIIQPVVLVSVSEMIGD